jgi:hypothetical protein
MLRFLSRVPVYLAFPPPPFLLLFALNLPRRLAAATDALSGMGYTDLLLLLPGHPDSRAPAIFFPRRYSLRSALPCM